jgi:DNA-binding LytR/AlgR family response regulator
VLIVDDEALARLRLRTLLQDVQQPACAVAGEAADADEALHACCAGGCGRGAAGHPHARAPAPACAWPRR